MWGSQELNETIFCRGHGKIVGRNLTSTGFIASESTFYRILREENQLPPPPGAGGSKAQKIARCVCDKYKESRPPVTGLQEQVTTHRKRPGSKALVVSVTETVPKGIR